MTPPARRYLSSLAAAGVRRMPRGVAPPAEQAPPARRSATTGGDPALPPELVGTPGTPGTPRSTADPEAALAAVAAEVAQCTRCELCKTRTLTVPGEGNPRPSIVFVGEGPGADEDRTGRPFVGRAGQLLDDIITKGMKRQRADVFIANVVKCRPPGNRDPTPRESSACRPFLERQLEILAPSAICVLGNTAAHLLLDNDLPMSRMRGGTFQWRTIPVVPTYHPAYLLRNEAAKRPTWEDIQRLMEIADRS